MTENDIGKILNEWSMEFTLSMTESKSFCLALFNSDKELVYANDLIKDLLTDNPKDRFVNPSLEELLESESKDQPLPVFSGFLTLGDKNAINTSLLVDIYRKNNELLILGGFNAQLLIQQNEGMLQLNKTIGELQRKLIKEKNNLKATLNKLNEANQKLEKLIGDKDQFISILAHDLKSPFNSILGMSEFLLESIKELEIAEIEEQVRIINKTSYQTYNLLEDLLLWTKSQANKLSLNIEPIGLNLLFNELSDEIGPFAERKSINMIFRTNNTSINADKNILKTVLRNLISNAIKFTNEQGVVFIKAEKAEKAIKISVKDNGIGMDQSTVNNLWTAGEKNVMKGTMGEKGTGFGLAACKDLIHKHGGKIEVKSTEGKGSEFYFSIPLNS